MKNTRTFGNKDRFGIEASFLDDSHTTELKMFINGRNILAFKRGNEVVTTRWNLDELVMWLRNFIDNANEDPYPVEVDGTFAAEKDAHARDFDSEDEEIFDAYYEKLYTWNNRHRWHLASSGAILADVYFQLVGENMELSWDNTCLNSEDVSFLETTGGISIAKNDFLSVMNGFLKAYADQWY